MSPHEPRWSVGVSRSCCATSSRCSPPRTSSELLEELTHEVAGLGPLEPLLADPTVTEVMINGPGRAYVERRGRLEPVALGLDAWAIVHLVERVVAPLGLRLDRSSPMVDARLPDGSRLHAVIPPLAVDGPCVTIRRFGGAGDHARRVRRDRRSPPTSSARRSTRVGTSSWPVPRAPERPRCSTRCRRRSRTPSGSSPSRRRPSCGSRSRTWCGSRRGPPMPRAWAGSRSASWCGPRCGCVPTVWWSARSAGPKRSTCSRRSTPGTTVRCRRSMPTGPADALARLETLVLLADVRAPARCGPHPGGREHRRRRVRGASPRRGPAGRGDRRGRRARPRRGTRALVRAPRRSPGRDRVAVTRPPRRPDARAITGARAPMTTLVIAIVGTTRVREPRRRGTSRHDRGSGACTRPATAVAGAVALVVTSWCRALRRRRPCLVRRSRRVEYWAIAVVAVAVSGGRVRARRSERLRRSRWCRRSGRAAAWRARAGSDGSRWPCPARSNRWRPSCAAAGPSPVAVERLAGDPRSGGARLRSVHVRTQLGLPLEDALAGWPADHDVPGVRRGRRCAVGGGGHGRSRRRRHRRSRVVAAPPSRRDRRSPCAVGAGPPVGGGRGRGATRLPRLLGDWSILGPSPR